jgi:hypothetical protein
MEAEVFEAFRAMDAPDITTMKTDIAVLKGDAICQSGQEGLLF